MKRRFVDLHTHSTASDGSLSPGEVVRAADVQQLAAVALTDHDTTAGIAEATAAAAACPQLHFVAGIEVSAVSSAGPMHVLGLGICPDSPQLAELSRRLLEARNERNPKIMRRLCEIGIPLEWSEVLASAGGNGRVGEPVVISRAHIAEALRRGGFVKTVAEAFARYVGTEGLAYVEKDRLGPAEVIGAIRAAGGIAAVAHPGHLHLDNNAQKERLLRDLKHAGLEAVEAYHCDHSDSQTRTWLDVARRAGLEVVGGSDFHGGSKPQTLLGRPRVPLSALGERVRERLGLA